MKLPLILLAIIIAAECTPEDWKEWKDKNKKEYKNEKEEKKRLQSFQKSAEFVLAHNGNRAATGYTLALNHLADLTPEEYSKMLGAKVMPTEPIESAPAVGAITTNETTSKPATTAAMKTTVLPPATTKAAPTTTRATTTVKVTTTIAKTTPKATTTAPTTPKPIVSTTAAPATTKGSTTDSIDWRKSGAVSSVKNQGNCGSCWTFGVSGALEGHYQIKYGKLLNLSQQNILDCASSKPYMSMGCNGGYVNDAFRYVRDVQGINLLDAYPYRGVQKNCTFNNDTSAKFAATTNRKDLPIPYYQVSPTEAGLINALKIGPLVVLIDAGQMSFQLYKSGVYDDPACSTTRVNHAVLLVGYGTDASINKPYWLIKNSWGVGWGEEGYMRMKRDSSNMCAILSYAYYPNMA